MGDPLLKSGGNMTGQLFLSGDPVEGDEAATKSYVDDAAGGGGSVTSVSVATANGFSGTVANSTTTPAITIIAGAITPTSVNSVVLSGSSTPILAVTGTSSISGSHTGTHSGTSSGTNTGDQDLSAYALFARVFSIASLRA